MGTRCQHSTRRTLAASSTEAPTQSQELTFEPFQEVRLWSHCCMLQEDPPPPPPPSPSGSLLFLDVATRSGLHCLLQRRPQSCSLGGVQEVLRSS